MAELFAAGKFDSVVHLAAQAGVRYSIENPSAYVDANLVGFMHVLEGCRHTKVGHLVFASSSSVYGANTRLPFSEHDNVDHPVSLYAATKKAKRINGAQLRSPLWTAVHGSAVLPPSTVPGPSGHGAVQVHRRNPRGRPIPVFNRGEMVRDFTYVDDIVEGVIRVMRKPAAPAAGWSGDRPDPATSHAPWRIFNIGNNQPVKLMRYIEVLEQCLGRKAQLELLPMQAGDVPATSRM